MREIPNYEFNIDEKSIAANFAKQNTPLSTFTEQL